MIPLLAGGEKLAQRIGCGIDVFGELLVFLPGLGQKGPLFRSREQLFHVLRVCGKSSKFCLQLCKGLQVIIALGIHDFLNKGTHLRLNGIGRYERAGIPLSRAGITGVDSALKPRAQRLDKEVALLHQRGG